MVWFEVLRAQVRHRQVALAVGLWVLAGSVSMGSLQPCRVEDTPG